MKSICFLIAFIVLLASCNKNKIEPVYDENGLQKPLLAKVYCQLKPDKLLNKIEYTYKNGRLSYEIDDDVSMMNPFTIIVEKFYEYDSNNLLVNIKQKTIKNTDGIIEIKENDFPREYQNGLLYKERTPSGGYYLYYYNNNLLSKKEYYINENTLKSIHTYDYQNNRLNKEIVTATPNFSPKLIVYTYEYDNSGHMIKTYEKIDDKANNLIMENIYKDNQLREKKTYYFGIDPGFDVCFGNYLFVYSY